METKPNIINRVLQFDHSLRQFAQSLTPNLEDVNDLLQDTYVKVMVNSSYYKEDTNLKAWVCTIMKNTFINNYRRRQKERGSVIQTEDLYHLKDYVSDPSNTADMRSCVAEINKAIMKQQEEQRQPLEMYIDGYKYQEIADAMNISIGTVKSRIFFTRKKIMEELKN
ncbi:MAG: RNA polymerase sigma factor [Bacteroidales bacterium]|jgi:RNA polymerase sigma-70 factor (ECF subfamily)|nr:RNA polymerase sigma factor [Bacteroidales bacterium]